MARPPSLPRNRADQSKDEADLSEWVSTSRGQAHTAHSHTPQVGRLRRGVRSMRCSGDLRVKIQIVAELCVSDGSRDRDSSHLREGVGPQWPVSERCPDFALSTGICQEDKLYTPLQNKCACRQRAMRVRACGAAGLRGVALERVSSRQPEVCESAQQKRQ